MSSAAIKALTGLIRSAVSAAAAPRTKSKNRPHKATPLKKKAKTGLSTVLTQSVTARPNYTPVSMARSITVSKKESIVTLPFDVIGPTRVGAIAGPLLVFANTSTSYTMMDLDINSTHSLFGASIGSLAGSFDKWRLLSLELTYEPFVPTNTAGSFVCAMVQDPATVSGSTSPNVEQVFGCTGATALTVYQPGKLCGSLFNKDWLYTNDPTARTSSSERQTSAGCVIIATTNPPSVATGFFGAIRARGVLQLCDLVGFRPSVPTGSAGPHTPPEDEHYVGDIPQKVFEVAPPEPIPPATRDQSEERLYEEHKHTRGAGPSSLPAPAGPQKSFFQQLGAAYRVGAQ